MFIQGATRPEIARATNFNFTTIKEIIDDYEFSNSDKSPSKRAQAYQLYALGNNPVSDAVKLDISAEEAERYYLDYLRLSDLGEFGEVVKAENGDLCPFLEFYHEIKSNH